MAYVSASCRNGDSSSIIGSRLYDPGCFEVIVHRGVESPPAGCGANGRETDRLDDAVGGKSAG